MNKNEIHFCNFIKLLNNDYCNTERANAYQEIESLKDTLKALEKIKQTKDVQRKVKEINIQINFYEEGINYIGTIIPEELFENLKKDNRILDIYTDGSSLLVKTKDIEFCGYNIGKYLIVIDFNKQMIEIGRADRNRVENKFDHVFVKKGEPCFGNKNLFVDKGLENGAFYFIIQLCLSLLSSRESDYTGAYISSKKFLNGVN